jgi:heat shock protein HspQ
MKSPFSEPTPPNELAVVGENKEDPFLLLLMGTDGSYYAYSLSDGNTKVVEPDDHWHIEPPSVQEFFA